MIESSPLRYRQAGMADVFRILLYFALIFSVVYAINGVSVVTQPGQSRFSVSCGLDNPVHYQHAGIYWKAGCTPGQPVIWLS